MFYVFQKKKHFISNVWKCYKHFGVFGGKNPKLSLSNDERHIILKRMNLEICEHSSFFNY